MLAANTTGYDVVFPLTESLIIAQNCSSKDANPKEANLTHSKAFWVTLTS